MKKTDLAYMAGLFDGEGCICIGKSKQKNGKDRYTLKVHITMANPYIPQIFRMAFGGYFVLRTAAQTKHLPTWRWSVEANLATDFLEVLSPYLKLKKSEAILAIEFQRAKYGTGSRLGFSRYSRKTEKERALEEVQYILMKNLKDKSGVGYGK